MNTNLALGFLYSGDIWDEDIPYELHDVGYEMLAELKGKDLVEVKHGEWVYQSGNYFTCTNCGGDMVRNVFPFCPWCGADMRGENK